MLFTALVIYFVVVVVVVSLVLGRMYEEERTQVDKVLEKRQYGVDGDRHSQYDGFKRPFPFKGRPRLGARMFVKAR